jgi:hypothetical protein
MHPDNERLILDRLGMIESKLNSSGSSIYRLIGETQANIEILKRVPAELDDLENQLIAIEARLNTAETRLTRQRDSLRLREIVDLINQVPGGWNSVFWILTIYIGLIDIAIDLLGFVPLIQRFLGV